MTVINKMVESNFNKDVIKKQEININSMYNRHFMDVKILYLATISQLNSEKNKRKCSLSLINPLDQIKLLRVEIDELEKEIRNKENINLERIIEEIGDCGAYLAGISSFVKKEFVK
nr:hypothetical protein GTC16762_33830 [Pigmentibacter ruber]